MFPRACLSPDPLRVVPEGGGSGRRVYIHTVSGYIGEPNGLQVTMSRRGHIGWVRNIYL